MKDKKDTKKTDKKNTGKKTTEKKAETRLAEQLTLNGFAPEAVGEGREPKTKPDSKEPTLAQWRELYEAAAVIRQIEPWRFLWDSDLVTLLLPGRAEPVYCMTMGRNGECYGIGVYPGYDALRGYRRLGNSTEDEPPFIAWFEQTSMICNFGDREELTPKDRALLKALDVKFRGRNEWVYFRRMDPGFFPWYIDAEQAALLIEVLQNYSMACRHLKSGELEVDFDNGQTLLRRYSPQQQLWLNSAAEMPPPPDLSGCLTIDDDLLIARLKKKKRNEHSPEFEMAFLPMPIQEQKGDRPYVPRFLLLADRNSGAPLDQYLADLEEDAGQTAIRMLAGYIGEHGRPRTISVRDERVAWYLTDFCKKLDIKLEVGGEMALLNAFFEEMMHFLDE